MRFCRFDDDRLGIVEGDVVKDVTAAAALLPPEPWPAPRGDRFMRHFDLLRPEMERLAQETEGRPLSSVRLLSPIANPGKIIGAPVNYQKHLDEARTDRAINFGGGVRTIDEYGLFLKAASSLVGPGEGVVAARSDRRIDHEVELAVVIGRGGYAIPEDRALEHVAGYAIGLDMTVRGTEDRSFRKSFDSFSVLGPWVVTADELPDASALDLELSIGGEVRQRSNTRLLIFGVPRLIAYASAAYRLYPGDVIMTGTPEGVAPVQPGDVMDVRIQSIGAMKVAVRGTP